MPPDISHKTEVYLQQRYAFAWHVGAFVQPLGSLGTNGVAQKVYNSDNAPTDAPSQRYGCVWLARRFAQPAARIA